MLLARIEATMAAFRSGIFPPYPEGEARLNFPDWLNIPPPLKSQEKLFRTILGLFLSTLGSSPRDNATSVMCGHGEPPTARPAFAARHRLLLAASDFGRCAEQSFRARFRA